MNNLEIVSLITASGQTIYMVFVASFLSIFLGLVCGIGLFVTNKGQILENRILNQILGFIINITRSIPFIILLISIIPLTRLIVGTSIGTNAAIVPLTIAAIPFFGRITENALKEIPSGLLEAAHAMGANNWQVIYKFLIPEALPTLVRGATLTVIGLIGYSAMAGTVGGGGLGELAISYGYQRFNVAVMLETLILLILIVQLVQWLGDYLAKKRHVKTVLVVCSVLLAIFIGGQFLFSTKTQDIIKVGVTTGPQEEVMKVVQKVAEKQFSLKVKVVVFNDYVLPNTALNNGNIDANIFQHIPYLEAQNKARGYNLVPIAKTFVYPMGFYSRKIDEMKRLKDNAIVAIPNDPSNEGRSLLILEKTGYIKLKDTAGLFGTPNDIISNPHNLQFKLLDSAQLPRVFNDADLVALTNDYVETAGFLPIQALIREDKNSPYANVIVVRIKDRDNLIFKKLIAAVQSKEVEQVTEKLFPNGAAIAAWKE